MSGLSLDTGVDTAGFLAGLLTGYEPTSILREQAQNADDACHVAGTTGWLRVVFSSTNIIVENPSILSDDDWRRLAKTSSRGKAADTEQTGEFGVGFWSILHLTDAPTITSGRYRATIDQLSGKPAVQNELRDPLVGTRFDLELRTSETEASKLLGVKTVTPEFMSELEKSFEAQIPQLLLFAKSLQRIELNLRDGSTVIGEREVLGVNGAVETVAISVDQRGESTTTRFLCLRGSLMSPPEGRSADLTVAFPLDDETELGGRVFCTFPTETVTGLPFSINAHFYAAMDRRSIAQVGPHGDWNDRLFRGAGRLIGTNLKSVLDVQDADLVQRLRWFIQRDGEAVEIARRRDFCLGQVDSLALQLELIPDRHGDLRRGTELCLLDEIANELLGDAVDQSVARPSDSLLVDLYRRWGVREWRRSDVAQWLAENAPAPTTRLSDAPPHMSSTAALKQILDYCGHASAHLGNACVALGTDDRLYPLGSTYLPRPGGRVGGLVSGLSTPVVHSEMKGTTVWERAPETTTGWFREALLAETPNVIGKTPQLAAMECFKSLNTVADALNILVEAGESLDGLPLAIDTARKIQVFDDTVLVGLPSGGNRPEAEKFLLRLGHRVLHNKVDDPSLSGNGVRRVTSHVLLESVRKADRWKSVSDTAGLLITCSLLVEGRVVNRLDLEPLMELTIWPTADGDVVEMGDLRLPDANRKLRSDQKQRVLSTKLCDAKTDQGRCVRRILEDLFERIPLDAAEECVASLENPPRDADDLYSAIDDLLGFWSRLHSSQKKRLKAAPFVPCADKKLRQPAEVLTQLMPLPLSLGLRQVDNRFRNNPRILEILNELGAHKYPSIDELMAVAQEISTQDVKSSEDPAHLLWSYINFDSKRYQKHQLERLGRIAWLPSNPDEVRRRPAGLLDSSLLFAQLAFPVVIGVSSPNAEIREALGIRGTLTAHDLVRLGQTAAEQCEVLAHEYFRHLERHVGNREGESTIASLRGVPLLPIKDKLAAPCELVSISSSALWEHLKTPVNQAFVDKYPRLSALWGISDTGEPTWRDHLGVLRQLADKSDLSESDVKLARRRMASIADALERKEVAETEIIGHHFVLTTKRTIVRPDEALRPDLPTSVVEKISPYVPIADTASIKTRELIKRLPLRSLRESVQLTPLVEGARREDRWYSILELHRRSILRFLRYVGADAQDDWVDIWPPVVQMVRSLRVRAYFRDAQLAEWDADCFLGESERVLTLWIKGSDTTSHSIVNAMATLYGIKSGLKTLLVAVLESETETRAQKVLDFDDIPQLEVDDPWSVAEPVSVDLDLRNESTVPGATDMNTAAVDTQRDTLPDEVLNDAVPVSEEQVLFEVESGVDLAALSATARNGDDSAAGHMREWVDDDRSSAAPRPEPPRVHTDWEGLRDGYAIKDVWEPETNDVDLGHDDESGTGDTGPRRKCVLSFYDWDNGYLPLRSSDSRALAGHDGVRSVTLFGRELPASQISEQSVEINGGRDLYLENEILPGTVIHLRPGLPGRIELHVNEDKHDVSDIWILELDEDGHLHREHIDSVTVRWETDGPVYRSERRWEDLDALHAEARASALDLVIRAFENFGSDGLTLDDVWSLVALNRLFSRSTINNHLYQQDGLFTNHDGIWRLTGATVKRVRGTPGAGRRGRTSKGTPTNEDRSREEQIMRLARQLRDLLDDRSDEMRHRVGEVIGLEVVALQEDRAFESSVNRYLVRPDEVLLSAIGREMSEKPELSNVAVAVLETTPSIEASVVSPLLDHIDELGVAGAVERARILRHQIFLIVEDDGQAADVVSHAENSCRRAAESLLTWADAEQAVIRAYRSVAPEPYDAPVEALDALVRLEQLVRRYAEVLGPVVSEERALFLARLDAAVGDTDAHGDVDRQELLATIRVLGDDRPAALDVMNEYAKLLRRASGDSGDAHAIFGLATTFAREAHVKNRVARFVAERAKEPGGVTLPVSQRTQHFVERWCEMARLRVPV